MTIRFLGTGTSVGVPTIGCQCAVCQSTDPHDKRLRCSALIETEATRILIDCGPDFRQQMLSLPFRRIDAVLLTHIHYDHVGGLDDLRPFCQFGEVNVYADEQTSKSLMQTIPYCFSSNRYPGVPSINLHTLSYGQMLAVGDLQVVPFPVMHGMMPITAYKIGKLTYITDMKSIQEDVIPMLEGTETLVVNALRYAPDHHSHQNVADALAFARRIGARMTWLIHSCHDIGLHEEVNRQLPPDVQLAYDGMVV